MGNDDFILKIMTMLDTKGIKSDYNKMKQMFEKDPAKINTVLDMSATKTEVNKFIKTFAPQLQTMFKNIGVDVNLKELESSMKSVFTESEKAQKQFHNAEIQAYKDNKTYIQNEINEKKKLYLDTQSAYKTNDSLIQKEINNKKQLYLDEKSAYVTNDSMNQKQISNQKKLYLDEASAYKTNANLKVAAENKIQAEIKKTAKDQKDANNLSSGKTVLNNNITSYLKNNSKLTTELKNKLLDIQSQIKKVDSTGLGKLKNSFRSVSSEAESLGQTGDNVFTKLGKNTQNFMNFLVSGSLIMTTVNALRSLVTTVVDLDKSMIDLQQATGYSLPQVKELMTAYITLGQEIGATGAEVANAASSWLRQGKSLADTNVLIKDSMILSKVGQMDSADATKYLTSAMKGYKVETSAVLGIIDKLSAIDISSATDVSGLAEAMSQVANTANIAGVSMDKLLSYLATVGEVTQKDMSSIGQSFQTMFSRMGNIKLGKMLDTDTGESLNDVEGVIGNLGIKLRDSKDSFRNFGDVLDDIGKKWNSYTDVEKNSLGVAIAGTRQRENFTTLMENYSKSLDYAGISATSSGVAMQKFSNYEVGVEANTKRLQASLEKLSLNTLNSGWIKGFLDIANVLVNVISKVGIFNIALVALGGVLGVKTVLGCTAFAESLTGLITTMGVGEATAVGFGTALSVMLPVIGALIAIGVGLAVFDHFNVTLEEQKKSLEEASQAYEDAKTKLSSINTELETTAKRIDELNAKPNLTFVEEAELTKLKAATTELLLQRDIANKTKGDAATKLADENKSTYDKTVGTKTPDEYTNTTNYTGVYKADNINEALAYKKQFEDLLSTTDFTGGSEGIAPAYKKIWEDRVATYTKIISDGITSVNDLRKPLLELKDDGLITPTQQKDLDAYTAKLHELYTQSGKEDDWKQIQFSGIFDSNSFKDSKTQLQKLAKSGELTPETLTSNATYKKLLDETGYTAEQVVENIKALNTETETTTVVIAKLSDEITSLSSLSDAMDTLDSAFAGFSAGTKVSLSDLTALQKQFGDTSGFEDFIAVLTNTSSSADEVKNAFATLTNSYIQSNGILDTVTEANKSLVISQLQQMGISNAEVLVNERLAATQAVLTASTEALALQKLYEADGSKRLADMTAEELIQFANEQGASEVTRQALANLALQKFDLGSIQIDESSNIRQLIALANAAGKSSYDLAAAQDVLDQVSSGTAVSLNSFEHATKTVDSVENGTYKWTNLDANDFTQATYSGASKTQSYYDGLAKDQKQASDDAAKVAEEAQAAADTAYKASYSAELAGLDHQLAMKTISQRTYYDQLDELNKRYFENNSKYLEENRQNEEKIYAGLLQLQSDAISAIEKLRDLEITTIKDQKQSEIDLMNTQKENSQTRLDELNAQIDKQKEAIQLLDETAKHEDELADKNKSVSTIQTALTDSQLDTSSKGKAKTLLLKEDLVKAQNELSTFQKDYALSQETAQLDQEAQNAQASYDAEAANLDSKIALVQAYLDNQGLLISDAMTVLNGMNESVLQNMIDNNKLNGDSISTTIVSAWNEAKDAVLSYSNSLSVLDAYNSLQAASLNNSVVSSSGNSSYTPPTNDSSSSNSPAPDASNGGIRDVRNVESGDTMWSYAREYYGDPNLYPKIEAANPDVNPYTMQIGSQILIPYKTGGNTGNYEGPIYAHKNEQVLNEGQSGDWKDLVQTILPNVQKMMGITKADFPNFTANNSTNSTPINYNPSITINGTVGKSELAQINTALKNNADYMYKQMKLEKDKLGY